MSLFLLTFLFVYSCMHALVFWGVHPLLKGHWALPTLSWLWMVSMIVAPVLVRLLERGGHEALARTLAWISYSWMGAVLIACSLFALIAGAEIILRLLPLSTRFSVHGPISAVVVLLITAAASFYGLYEANNLRVEQVRIVSPKLAPGSPAIRIAQISDLHLGLIHRNEALAPVISRLQELHPDLVVATGDIVDAQIDQLEELTAAWQRLEPPLGKFTVTGNHEFYAGLRQSLTFLENSGFQVLRNRSLDLGERLRLVGVDDPAGGELPEEEQLLANSSARFTLLLKHRPQVKQGSGDKFDLQLSGHTHRGQIFPFNLLTGLRYPMQDGLYPIKKGTFLYTSRGTGTWGPPMRVLSPPEITLFEIVPEQD